MKFTLSWLKEHLDTTAPVDEITETLTGLGLEVEGVENRLTRSPISPSARFSAPQNTPTPTA